MGRQAGSGRRLPRAQAPLLNAAGQSPLWLAASEGQLEALRSCLASSDAAAHLDLQDDEGCSPLLIACQEGHVQAVLDLLSAGAKADLQDNYGASALFMASQAGHVDIVRALLCERPQVSDACSGNSLSDVVWCLSGAKPYIVPYLLVV